MSPWAASRLKVPHIRGSDIEEPQPHSLVRELAQLNPENRALQSMVELTKDGYKRPLAAKLFTLAAGMREIKDTTPGGTSLREQVIRTLEVEVERANRQARSSAHRCTVSRFEPPRRP